MTYTDRLLSLQGSLAHHALPKAPGARTTEQMVDEARTLMDTMHVMTGVDPDPREDGPSVVMTDMLIHMMHLADAEELNFDDILDQASKNHIAEKLDIYGLGL